MGFGGGATLAGLALEPLGHVSWGAYPWLTWTVRFVEWSAGFPLDSVWVSNAVSFSGVKSILDDNTSLVPELQQESGKA
jgi:hypothetical protein